MTSTGTSHDSDVTHVPPQAQFIGWFDRQIWTTKGSRLEAYRRLAAAHRFSPITIAFLSSYSIFGTILPIFLDLGLSKQGVMVLNLSLVGLSIFILVLSLLEAGHNYQLRAERVHDCALELGGLYDRFRIQARDPAFETDRPEQLTLAREYHVILAKYKENHLPIDYDRFRSRHPNEFSMTWRKRQWIRAFHWARSYGVYLLLIVGPPLGGALLAILV